VSLAKNRHVCRGKSRFRFSAVFGKNRGFGFGLKTEPALDCCILQLCWWIDLTMLSMSVSVVGRVSSRNTSQGGCGEVCQCLLSSTRQAETCWLQHSFVHSFIHPFHSSIPFTHSIHSFSIHLFQ